MVLPFSARTGISCERRGVLSIASLIEVCLMCSEYLPGHSLDSMLVWFRYSHQILSPQYIHTLFFSAGRSWYSNPTQTKLLSVNHSMPYHHLEHISERAISTVVYHVSLPAAVSCQAHCLQVSTVVFSTRSFYAMQTMGTQSGTAVKHTDHSVYRV